MSKTTLDSILSVLDKSNINLLSCVFVPRIELLLITFTVSPFSKDLDIPVTKVSEYTSSPEILNGRVKTLHPKIHGGILAQRGNPVHDIDRNANDIGLIDIVAVNLYPFKETVAKSDVTLEDAIENIDIGGPSMVRSAAKNYKDVAVMTNPHQYGIYMDSIKGNISIKPDTLRKQFMLEAFKHTAEYDTAISSWMSENV